MYDVQLSLSIKDAPFISWFIIEQLKGSVIGDTNAKLMSVWETPAG